MRGLKSLTTAQALLDGWLVHYNFFRPHESLDDKTPADVAGIKYPYKNWLDVIEGQRLVINEPDDFGELTPSEQNERLKYPTYKAQMRRKTRKVKRTSRQDTNTSLRGIRR